MKAKLLALSVLVVLLFSIPVEAQEAKTYKVFIPISHAKIGKIGVAPGGYRRGDLVKVQAPWTYLWHAGRGDRASEIPNVYHMIWGMEEMTSALTSPVVMGFNEPDLAEQANMTPEEMAVGWRLIEKWYGDRVLVSPACSQFHPNCIWDMVKAYKILYKESPRFDKIAIHYYRWGDSMPSLEEYVADRKRSAVLNGYNAPIWITEFGACGIDEVAEFNRDAQFIESSPIVEMAAWYKLRPDSYDTNLCSSLLYQDGDFTPLGEAYRDWVRVMP